MNETNKSSAIENKVRSAAAETRRSGTGTLTRQLRRTLRLLRERYTSLMKKPVLEGWEQWLFDNYYVLEGHAKQTLSDLRGIRRDSARLFWLCSVLSGVFADGEAEINEENAENALRAAGTIEELTESQLAFMFTALKCALLSAAVRACGEEYPAELREKLISYAVVGLSQIYEIDFEGLASRCSAVEAILMQDPSSVYPHMAEPSRAHYRRVAARIARHTGVTESAVARDVLTAAQKAEEERERHVGFYLMRHDPQTASASRRGKAALFCAWILPLFFCAPLALMGHGFSALLAYLPLVEIVRVLVSGLALRRVPASHIPRMKLEKDAPKTVIAVSTLLPDASHAEGLRVRLEQLYFSNNAENLYFCVLADFKEDRKPYNPRDDRNVEASQEVVEALNRQYGAHFMLFIRRRTYNRTQDAYSGWERKRGAITEFIRFLKGGETSVLCFVGDRAVLPALRYLIALDSDTNLGFESANTLVSAAVHPLNRPVIGKHNLVTAGYGILVPRMETDLPSAKATDFTRIMAGAGGISSYEQECCDFYQDLFGTAVFCGKGLIDIDAFHTVVGRRFPENSVLSHDILEGAFLRAGLLSDVEMTDGMPASAISWFTRLHRWMRGDWQNLRFLGKSYELNNTKRPNPIGSLSRYQLFDNLRRSITPVISFVCVLVSCFTGVGVSFFLCLTAFLSVSLSPLIAGLRSLFSGGRFALTRRFFARTLPRVFELFGQAGLYAIMLAQQAVVTLDAIGRTLHRLLVTHKNLLQWTTAAQGEVRDAGLLAVLRRSWISELAGLLLLVFAPRAYLPTKLFGLLFLLYAPIAAASSRVVPDAKNLPSRRQREQLLSWSAQMFDFYEQYANEENHWLPPDNVQFSPRETVARRTSPTNIGMMMLSFLAARDFHFIDSPGLYLRLTRTLDTIETLETREGNLYNWYATDDLRVLPDYFVSAVDSGNYLCSLVALKEGLYEYAGQEPRLRETAARVEKILRETDFSIFYNARRRLLSIGIDQNGNLSGSHYDFLMSEARTAGYFAVATRQADYKHWRALNRTMSRTGVYAGPVSWTGTMFEYFMPHLLLPAYEGSLLGEALRYALYCQKRRAHRANVPWGISESGFYAFDEQLNYQYKAHGVQSLGVKQGLDRECVIAPYATFLTLPFDLDGGLRNLHRLEELGLCGRYGFYEAVDFTRPRTGLGGAVVRSYMAHHVGMSLIACANALSDNVMQKRFMRDHAMRAAREFLQEKISKDTVVYDQMKPEQPARRNAPKEPALLHASINPPAPTCTLLAGGDLTHLLADTGAGWLRFSDSDVTRRPLDPLAHPQGLFAVARMCGETVCASAAPFYQENVERSCEFGPDSAAFHAKKGNVELIQRFSVEKASPVERCTLTLLNHSGVKAVAEVLFYCEPVLSRQSDYAAHPAFSKLFVLGARDEATNSIVFYRKNRDGSDGLFLSVGFEKHYDFEYALKREDITPYPDGLQSLLQFHTLPFHGGTATPDGCCALRLAVTVPAHGEQVVTLLLSAAAGSRESADNLAAARSGAPSPNPSPFMDGSMTGRLGMRLLAPMLMAASPTAESLQALSENDRGQDALWSLGISGDLPLVLYDWRTQPDEACLEAFIQFWSRMRLLRLDFDLVVMCGETPPMPLPNGVRALNIEILEEKAMTALYAAACHVAGGEEPISPPLWNPAQVRSTEPAEIPLEGRFDVVGGAYADKQFYVSSVTPLPFSHILANPSFGTLVHDAGLGNTWWTNARECKLSPWTNDIASGNDGEKLLLSVGGAVYDLCRGARASFSPQEARWEGTASFVETTVRVQISDVQSVKFIDVLLENKQDREAEIICAYSLEPVLGVSRLTAKYTRYDQQNGCLLLHNPYNAAVSCHMAVRVPDEYPSWTVNRTAFLAGDWSASELLPNHDPIAGTVVRKRLPPRRKERIRFILSAAETADAALAIAQHPLDPEENAFLPHIEIDTPDEPLNHFFNSFLPHQVLAGRMYGRCAFYQCSGAYGFRDQLQDAGACLLTNPKAAKAQILRCCAAQFEEGDVLHWWHELPTGTRGVRTTFSDDLLWLPYLVCEYLEATGDTGLLTLEVRYCSGEPLKEGEQERYQEVRPSGIKETVFQHCIRAVERGYQLGNLGIPKIGCGDWNDGFSAIGTGGEGQSVWLGMFLSMVLDRFSMLCDAQGDPYRASVYKGNAVLLRANIDKNCWDGRWYLRAFYDDGAPLGGHSCEACQIDLLSQSFAVLAGMPDRIRVDAALDSALHYLVDCEERIIKLFTPPFTGQEAQNPGYISAYPAGIRENGGQYTHAAVWFALALLRQGRAEDGWRMLDMLNPTSRCTDADSARSFKTEPYYMPADIYTNSGAYGHGGWSIYTGAAAWYYRAVTEGLLGILPRGEHLELQPVLPQSWKRFGAKIHLDGCEIGLEVLREGTRSLTVDGKSADTIPLDGKNHNVLLTI